MQGVLVYMTKKIDFYFDIISPYSFLAHKKILKIEKKEKILFNYKPILLGGLHNLLNITAPAFVKSKNKYFKKDCIMVAKKFNINFNFNKKFPINSLDIMRGILVINKNKKREYINKFFDAYWYLNKDLSQKKQIIKILNELKIDKNNFFLMIKDIKIKKDLKKLTNEAYLKNVFGAPTFIVNKKIFWGQDRLEYALEEFKNLT